MVEEYHSPMSGERRLFKHDYKSCRNKTFSTKSLALAHISFSAVTSSSLALAPPGCNLAR
jgi:hypothetical protein